MKNRAILFCENNDKIETLAEFLVRSNWEIISAGETARILTAKNIPFREYECLDNSDPDGEIFPNLVKNILKAGRTSYFSDDSEDQITLVCTNLNITNMTANQLYNLYFIKKEISIKKTFMLHAAIKNYSSVLILTDPADYSDAMLKIRTDSISQDFRIFLASKALNISSAFSAALSDSIFIQNKKFFFPSYFMIPYQYSKKLKHGVNKQQIASLYKIDNFPSSLNGLKKIQGSETSFNAMINVNAAWKAITYFMKLIKSPFSIPTVNHENYPYTTQFSPMAGNVFTIGIKNATVIGASLASNVTDSLKKTYSCDIEAFQNAVIGSSSVIDENAANEIKNLNIRTIVAPDFTKEARQILSENKKFQLLLASNLCNQNFETISIDGGLLIQTTDSKLFDQWKVVTVKRPDQIQVDEMAFGMMVILSSKSYSAVVIKNHATVGISTGQSTMQKAIRYAMEDSKNFSNNQNDSAEILVCDSAITFDDRLKCIADYGIKAIIQTGGNPTDEAFINYCNEKEICMVFTGIQHLTY